MKSVSGTKLTSSTPAALVDAIADVVPESVDGPDPVVVLADAQYPHHPSTGLVTNPETVAAVADRLAAASDRTVLVAPVGSEHVAGCDTAQYLEYDRALEGVDAELLELESTLRVERTVTVDGRTVELVVPEPLVDGTVVAVPSLRADHEFGIAGATVTVARAVTDDLDDRTVAAATRLVDPAYAVLDGTFAYAGEPRQTDVVFGSEDAVAIDATIAELLGDHPETHPHLELLANEVLRPGVTGVAVHTIAASLPDGELPDYSEPSAAMTAAYRLYAIVAGDAVPPQFANGPGDWLAALSRTARGVRRRLP